MSYTKLAVLLLGVVVLITPSLAEYHDDQKAKPPTSSTPIYKPPVAPINTQPPLPFYRPPVIKRPSSPPLEHKPAPTLPPRVEKPPPHYKQPTLPPRPLIKPPPVHGRVFPPIVVNPPPNSGRFPGHPPLKSPQIPHEPKGRVFPPPAPYNKKPPNPYFKPSHKAPTPPIHY